MGKWEIVRLGKYIKQIRGVSYKPEDTSELQDERHLPLLRAHNIQPEGLNFNNLVFVNRVQVRQYQYLKKGDIVVCASSGSKDLVGKAAQATKDMNATFGAFCKVVRPGREIDAEYLKHYFSSSGYRREISRLSAGANINNLRNEHIDDLQIPLPPLDVQQQIADVLNRASALIEKRKVQIDKLDLLVKSQFVEMFGTVYDTEFPVKKLSELTEIITDGTHQTPTYTDDAIAGYKFLSSKDVTSRYIDWSRVRYIPESLHFELYSRIAPQRNDILLAKNGTTGVAAIVDTDDVFDIYVSLALLRFLPGNSIRYVWAAMNSSATKHQFDASLKGVGVPNLHLREIRNTKIIVPPIDLQNQFAAIVDQAESQKTLLQQSLAEMELNYKSLMQKCFRGEIF